MRKAWVALLALFSTAILVMPAGALPPSSWTPGKEKEKTGHAFTEEYWTSGAITNTTADNATASFTMSYVNSNDVQAFLVAMNTVTKGTSVGTLPWQMFGMHYYTPRGSENFLVAVLAFLLAFNDTNGNGMPDHGNEPTYYIIPFGAGDALSNVTANYMPEAIPIPAKKLGDGHYQFGMTYKNLYAKIISADNIISFWLSAALPLFIARFSELSVTYDITIDPKTKVAKAESFYTIGQVDRLWLWGRDVGREALPDNFGISAVHYLATFASTYSVVDASGTKVVPNIQKPLDQNLTLKIGKDERAMDIGYGSKFDLKDEANNSQLVAKDRQAYNMLVAARPGDSWLVAWQAGFTLDVLCTIAYGLSKDIRGKYTSPLDLYQKGRANFWAAAMWYGVSFPSWKGYRVEHDPSYTAYFGAEPAEKAKEACSSVIVVGGVLLMAAPAVVWSRSRRKGEN
jgi:hypothetical protein